MLSWAYLKKYQIQTRKSRMRRKYFKSLIKQFEIRPKKRLGQHFLVDFYLLKKISKCIKPKGETIVEVGAGLGFLTELLAQEAKRVIAIEKDHSLVLALKERLRNFQNVEILEMDILDFSPEAFLRGITYKAVGNLPYSISYPVIRLFLETNHQPKEMVFLIQREVAQKICAKKSSLPKIAVEFYAKPKILFYVPKNSFFPKPKVDGAVIQIKDIHKGIPGVDRDLFFKIVKAGFAHPRKTILNNLSSELKLEKGQVKKILEEMSVSSQKRPQDLSFKDWVLLCQNLS